MQRDGLVVAVRRAACARVVVGGARHALAAHLLDEEEALIKLADHAHNLRVANDRRGASIHEIAAVGAPPEPPRCGGCNRW